jgi:small conductance mechanosensitive channel
MPFWHRLLVVLGVIAVSAIVAKLIDRRMVHKELAPEAVTRYRVLRRSVMGGVIALGLLSALLVIPQVRAVAGGLLASSAILGLVIGFAARSTLANFVAGLLIAFAQPFRIGDRVSVGEDEGIVEEIGLTYTFIRTSDNDRVVVPNEKLALDTIRNSTIVSQEKLAQVTVQVPLASDVGVVVDLLRETASERSQVLVTGLEGAATVTLCDWAPDPNAAERLESDLRLRAHRRLREAGVFS